MFNENINLWLQDKLQSDFFDRFVLIITQGGDEIFFMIVAVLFYLCIDKKFGARFIYGFIFASFFNEMLKMIFRIPRPYEKGVQSIGGKTRGWSFPSGHSCASAMIATPLAVRYGSKKRRWVWLIGAFFVLAIMFSRVYLGQHYVIDTVVGALLGIGLAVGIHFLFKLMGDKEHIWPAVLIPVFIVLCCILRDNTKLFIGTGTYCGIALGYFLDKKFIKYQVKAKWWIHILKLAAAFPVIAALQFGIVPLFENIETAVAVSVLSLSVYFSITLWVSAGLPALIMLAYRKCKYEPEKMTTDK